MAKKTPHRCFPRTFSFPPVPRRDRLKERFRRTTPILRHAKRGCDVSDRQPSHDEVWRQWRKRCDCLSPHSTGAHRCEAARWQRAGASNSCKPSRAVGFARLPVARPLQPAVRLKSGAQRRTSGRKTLELARTRSATTAAFLRARGCLRGCCARATPPRRRRSGLAEGCPAPAPSDHGAAKAPRPPRRRSSGTGDHGP